MIIISFYKILHEFLHGWLSLQFVSKAKLKLLQHKVGNFYVLAWLISAHLVMYTATNTPYVHVTTDTVSAGDKPIKTFCPEDKEVSKADVRIKMM